VITDTDTTVQWTKIKAYRAVLVVNTAPVAANGGVIIEWTVDSVWSLDMFY